MAMITVGPRRYGPCMSPDDPSDLSGDADVPVAAGVVEVADEEAFVNIAASGELGERPRSSVHLMRKNKHY